MLKRQKRKSWKILVGIFYVKTPTAQIWSLIRIFKKRELAGTSYQISGNKIEKQIELIARLTTVSILAVTHRKSRTLEFKWRMLRKAVWISRHQVNELCIALASTKPVSALELNQIDYKIILTMPDMY